MQTGGRATGCARLVEISVGAIFAGLRYVRQRTMNRFCSFVVALCTSWALGAYCCVGCVVAGCHSEKQVQSPTQQARQDGPESRDPEVVGRWLLAELISADADMGRAQKARARLIGLLDDDGDRSKLSPPKGDSKRSDALDSSAGLYAYLARGLDAESRGELRQSVRAYWNLLKVARQSSEPISPLAGWYAALRLRALSSATPDVWNEVKSEVVGFLDQPAALNWRARAKLVEWWWAQESKRLGDAASLEGSAQMLGCVGDVRLVGPFGDGVVADAFRSFEPEKPGRWPAVFPASKRNPNAVASTLATKRRGCEIRAEGYAPEGVYYAETFVSLDHPQDVVLSAAGAFKIWVDDVLVLERDPRQWAVGLLSGLALRLRQGRHRIMAKYLGSSTAMALMHLDGTPLRVEASSDATLPYAMVPPQKLADPNLLTRYVRRGQVVRPSDDVELYLAAFLAHVENRSDVASLLMEPLVKRIEKAGPVALELQAQLAVDDPIYPSGMGKDLAREIYQVVAKKAPGFWKSRYWLAVQSSDKRGMTRTVDDLRELNDQFPQVDEIGLRLVATYVSLGWTAQGHDLLSQMVKRSPHNLEVLGPWAAGLDSMGRGEQADKVVAAMVALDPRTDAAVERALRRQDYPTAIAELKRLRKFGDANGDIATRMAQVMIQAGVSKESVAELEKSVKDNPTSDTARMSLADYKFAGGTSAALREAITRAMEDGADASPLDLALDLVEGKTALDAYRLDGLSIVREFENSGQTMEGEALRVLDYGVVWIRSDGSSRMLEHQIIKAQTQAAVTRLAEQPLRNRLPLRARVIKKDGRVLEPEIVVDKPTLTMPHMELGDYCEIEMIHTLPADSKGGVYYAGPHWFFQEHEVGYWRSEFVVIAPKDRTLDIESSGNVPAMKVVDRDPLIERRWRADKSPAAVVEPGSAPRHEVLPNVRLGWGITREASLELGTDKVTDVAATDPRLVRIAHSIVRGIEPSNARERAKRVYYWVLNNIEPSSEADGRKIVMGRSGDRARAYAYLMRLLKIRTDYAVARSALERQPYAGPMSEVDSFSHLLMRVELPERAQWVGFSSRFTPFGYVPWKLRGQTAYLLRPGAPKVTVSTDPVVDKTGYEGTAELRPTGTASMDATFRYWGAHAIPFRETLERVPEAQLLSVFESALLSQLLPGASLVQLKVLDRDDLDKPLSVKMKTEMPDFARRADRQLLIGPPFGGILAPFVGASSRTTTLLLTTDERIEVKFQVRLPAGAKVVTTLAPTRLVEPGRRVEIHDRVEGDMLVLDRFVALSAARVAPKEFPAFAAFIRRGDEALRKEIRIQLP